MINVPRDARGLVLPTLGILTPTATPMTGTNEGSAPVGAIVIVTDIVTARQRPNIHLRSQSTTTGLAGIAARDGIPPILPVCRLGMKTVIGDDKVAVGLRLANEARQRNRHRATMTMNGWKLPQSQRTRRPSRIHIL